MEISTSVLKVVGARFASVGGAFVSDKIDGSGCECTSLLTFWRTEGLKRELGRSMRELQTYISFFFSFLL